MFTCIPILTILMISIANKKVDDIKQIEGTTIVENNKKDNKEGR